MYKGFFWKTGIHKRNLDLSKLEYRGANREEINTDLQKRLGIKRIVRKNITPCLNLSLASMKGERWKDIPGYEGLYQISNFGRVKALRKITHGDRKRMWMPEQIKRLSIRLDKNSKKPVSAFIMVSKDGIKTTIGVSRYVYYLFVRNFDINDSILRVYYRDGNALNTYYKNLVLKRGVWSFDRLKDFL
jgi:hypothetical protein